MYVYVYINIHIICAYRFPLQESGHLAAFSAVQPLEWARFPRENTPFQAHFSAA